MRGILPNNFLMSETEYAAIFQAPEIEEVALLFPAYDVHSLIACGGMGAVYKATQRSLDRMTAIKILPREFSTDEEFRKGFESEAKAMAKLNHPNLIGVYDFGEAGGMLYIIMEYVAGQSLFHSTDGYEVEQGDALSVVINVCAGLEHAHSHGILHRDIKPGNILLDLTMKPKIGDFGLARALESQIQEGEQIFGTPGYTAPEVLSPPFTFDQRADVFSVGVMLHELLTGGLPEVDPRPPSQICGCNSRLDAVIKKATNPDPDMRYSSAFELGAALDAIAKSPAGALLTTSSPGAAHKIYTPPKYQKKSSSSGLGFLVFLLVIAAGVAYLVMNKEELLQMDVDVDPPEFVPPEVKVIDIRKRDANGNPIEGPAPDSKERAPDQEKSSSGSSQFDVPRFLQKARVSMGSRIRPYFEKVKSETQANTKSYGRELSLLTAKLDPVIRGHAEKQVADAEKQWAANGYQLPETMPDELKVILGSAPLHKIYYAKQTGISHSAIKGIRTQSGIYVLSLEDQIELLKKSGNKAAINEIRKEIGRVQNQERYFPSLFE